MTAYKITRTYFVRVPETGTPEFEKARQVLKEEYMDESADELTMEGLAIQLTYMEDVGDGIEGTECSETNTEVEPWQDT